MMKKICKKIIIGLLVFILINIWFLLFFKAKVPIFYATIQVYAEYYIKDYWSIDSLFKENWSCSDKNWEKLCGYTDYNNTVFFFYYKHYIYNSKWCDLQEIEKQDKLNDLVKIIPLSKNICVALYTLA